MTLSDADIQALWLTLKLASLVTALLLMIATPLALWLSRSKSRATGVVNAVVALPLVLPPSVLGFYLLIAMGPDGPLGKLTTSLGLGTLPFTFAGLVIGAPLLRQVLQCCFDAAGLGPTKACKLSEP